MTVTAGSSASRKRPPHPHLNTKVNRPHKASKTRGLTVALLDRVHREAERVPVQAQRGSVRLADVQGDVARAVHCRHRLFYMPYRPIRDRVIYIKKCTQRTGLHHELFCEAQPPIGAQDGDGGDVPMRILVFLEVLLPEINRSYQPKE
jgi:hypothetical protein